jgi:hypothetical protein
MCTLLFQHESVGKAASVHVQALVRPSCCRPHPSGRALVQEHTDSVLWKPLTANSRLVARLVHGGCAVGVAWGSGSAYGGLRAAVCSDPVHLPHTVPTTPTVSSTEKECSCVRKDRMPSVCVNELYVAGSGTHGLGPGRGGPPRSCLGPPGPAPIPTTPILCVQTGAKKTAPSPHF